MKAKRRPLRYRGFSDSTIRRIQLVIRAIARIGKVLLLPFGAHKPQMPLRYRYALYVGGVLVGTFGALALGEDSGWRAFFPYGFLVGIAGEYTGRLWWWLRHRQVAP